MKKKQQLLLLEDVDDLGRSGEIVSAKSGYFRNFLYPQQKAVIVDAKTLKLQAALKEAREKRAQVDLKESEALAARLAGFKLSKDVKIDPEGNMYGSVTLLEIAKMMNEQGYAIERNNILLQQPIRTLGEHTIALRLKEGVTCSFTLEITPEGGALPTSEKT